jgi:hypothetical protein
MYLSTDSCNVNMCSRAIALSLEYFDLWISIDHKTISHMHLWAKPWRKKSIVWNKTEQHRTGNVKAIQQNRANVECVWKGLLALGSQMENNRPWDNLKRGVCLLEVSW